jgi:hypothetical protein
VVKSAKGKPSRFLSEQSFPFQEMSFCRDPQDPAKKEICYSSIPYEIFLFLLYRASLLAAGTRGEADDISGVRTSEN